MAELAALTTVTSALMSVLDPTWASLKAAYTAYQGVKHRRAQLGFLLERCQHLLIELDPLLSQSISERMKDNLFNMARWVNFHLFVGMTVMSGSLTNRNWCSAIQKIFDLVVKNQQQGFVWCLIHSGEIDKDIENGGTALSDVFTRFNVCLHSISNPSTAYLILTTGHRSSRTSTVQTSRPS